MITKTTLQVGNMQCASCENRIEKALNRLPGINNVKAHYANGTVQVEYDPASLEQAEIEKTLQSLGYQLEAGKSGKFQVLSILLVFGLLLFLGSIFGDVDLESRLSGRVTFLVLFTIGLISSLHCTGMCGGLMLSQSISGESEGKLSAMFSALSYHAGRVLSYTLLGGIVGALGSIISFSLTFKAGVMILAGLFMILMGLKMGGFTALHGFSIKLPWAKKYTGERPRTPFIVGLLNGFMPCGPLQTMQLYALGTGSAVDGAVAMLAFALGTVPLMLGFGVLASFLNKGYTRKILRFSGVLVIALGLVMANRGLSLAGINPLATKLAARTPGGEKVAMAAVTDGYQTVKMAANNQGYVPNALVVQKGIPVRWVVDGEKLNSCNNALVVPSLNIQRKLNAGENIIEFTPTKSGDISFSCWMGMIRGVIKVVDNLETADVSGIQPPASSGGSCCAGGEEEFTSIYGDDLSKVPTDRLIKKAVIGNNSQSVTFTGISYEFTPLYVLVQKGIPARLNFDLDQFADPAGAYFIANAGTGEIAGEFTVKEKSAVFEFLPKEPGIYVIVKYRSVLGVIEVVDKLDSVDLEEIRRKNF